MIQHPSHPTREFSIRVRWLGDEHPADVSVHVLVPDGREREIGELAMIGLSAPMARNVAIGPNPGHERPPVDRACPRPAPAKFASRTIAPIPASAAIARR